MRHCRFLIPLLLVVSTALQAGAPPEFSWAKAVGGGSEDYGNAVAVDGMGNSVTVGSFSGNGNFLGTGLASAGADDIFLVKLNSSGAPIWARRAGGSTSDEPYAVAMDGAGNVYAAGRFTGTANFGTTNLTTAGTHDMFLTKYDVNGNVVWARRAGGTDIDYANGVATDASGNVFVTGVFTGSATFDGVTLTSAGAKDIFIAKYDSAGNFLWARRAGGTGTDVSFNIATDASGNAYIVGWFVFTANFSGTSITVLGTQDIFLAKYDANGNFLWVRQAGGSASYDYGYSVAVDPFGNPCITGSFRSTSSFSGTMLTSSGSSDMFVAKYNASGNLLWAQKAGSPDGSSPFKPNDDEGYGVAMNQFGDVFVTGYFNATATFSGTNVTSRSSYQDVFVAKYSSSGVFDWVRTAGGASGSDYGNSIALDGSGNAYVPGTFYSTAAFGTNNISSAGARDVFVTKINTANPGTPPVISNVSDKSFNEDSTSGPIAFTVNDAETPAANLIVGATSSNPALLSNLALGGSGTDRTLTITPVANAFGTATVTLTVTDSDSDSSSNSFLVTVNPVNDPPTLNAFTNVVVNEDSGTTTVNFGGVSSGAGNEIQTLSVSATSSNPGLVPNPTINYTSANATGSLSFAPLANASGTATITVTVQDDGGTANGGNNSFSRTFLVTVNPVNDPPTISSIGAQTISKNTSTAALPFVIGDIETAATSLSVSGNSSNTGLIPNANIVFGGSGNNRTVTVSPATDQTGSATITIAVNDGSTIVTTSFLVTVVAVNSPPTISPIADQVTNEDTPTGAIPFTVGDPDGLAGLILSANSANTNLVPNANVVFGGSGSSRTVTISPALNQFGSATMTISVSDGVTNATRSFLFTVNAVNDPPTITSIGAQSIAKNTSTAALPFVIGDVETAVTSLSVSGASSNTGLIPNANIVFGGGGNNRTVTISPATDQIGSATITIGVNDGATNVTTSFLVTVIAVNAPPTISPIANQSINEDTSTAPLPFVIGDAETPATSLGVSGNSSNTGLIPNANIVFGGSGINRTVTISPAPNQFGVATITISVSDGSTIATNSFLVTVNPINDVPTISAITDRVTNEDTPTAAIPFIVSDIETPAANLVLSASSSSTALVPNSNVVFDGSGTNRTLVITPSANQFGTSIINIFVNDGNATNSTSFLLTVNSVNDAPTLNALSNLAINEDSVANVSLSGITSGAINEPQVLSVVATSSNPSLIPNPTVSYISSSANGSLSIVPVTNASGTATITVTVQDDGGTANGGLNTFTRSFLVTVNAVNDAPAISHISNQTIRPNTSTGPIAFVISDVETASTSLVLSRVSSDTKLIPNANIVLGGSGSNRTVTISPFQNRTGTATITISVSDGTITASNSFLVTVTTANIPPTIDAIANRETNEDTPTGPIAFTVSDGDTAAISLIVSATSSNTTLVPNANLVLGGSGTNRTLAITPATNQFGSSVITVSANDGTATTTSSFLLTVQPVNDAPVFSPMPTQIVNEGATLLVTNHATDVDAGDALSFFMLSGPSGASLTTNGIFSWTPTEQQGPNTNLISIRVSDNGVPVMSSTSVLTVVVAEVNSAPNISPVANRTVAVGTTLWVTNVATDLDIPANALTFSLLSALPGANLTANGIFSWTPTTAQAASTNVVMLRVSDNGVPSLSATSSFVVTVSPLVPELIKIDRPQYVAGNTKLSFTAQAGQAYQVEYAPGTSGPWFRLAGFRAPATTTNFLVNDGVYDSNRVYRLVLPDAPPRIDRLTRNSDRVRLFFATEAGRVYQIQSQDVLGGPWTILTNITAAVSTNSFSYLDARKSITQQFYRVGLQPRLATFSEIQRVPTVFSFQFVGTVGENYTVEYCQNPADAWWPLTNITPTVTTNILISDNGATDQKRFYRVKRN